MWDLGLGGRVILEQQDGILGCGRKQGTQMNMDRGPVVVMQSPPCSGVPGNWGLTCWGLENLPVQPHPTPTPFSLLLALTVPSRHHSMLLLLVSMPVCHKPFGCPGPNCAGHCEPYHVAWKERRWGSELSQPAGVSRLGSRCISTGPAFLEKRPEMGQDGRKKKFNA